MLTRWTTVRMDCVSWTNSRKKVHCFTYLAKGFLKPK